MQLVSSGNRSRQKVQSSDIHQSTIIDGSFTRISTKRSPFKITSLLTWSLAGLLLVNLSFQILIFSKPTSVLAMESSPTLDPLNDNVIEQALPQSEPLYQALATTSTGGESDIESPVSTDLGTSEDVVSAGSPVIVASEVLNSFNQEAELTQLGHGDGGEWIGVSLPDGRLAWVTSEPVDESLSLETLLTIKPTNLSVDNLDQQEISAVKNAEAPVAAPSTVQKVAAPSSNTSVQPSAQPLAPATTDSVSSNTSAQPLAPATTDSVDLIAEPSDIPVAEDLQPIDEEDSAKPVTYASITPWSLYPPSEFSSDEKALFEWEIEMVPDIGQGFEVIFWKPGQDPLEDGFGLAAPSQETTLTVNLLELDRQLGQLLEPGLYHWGVLLVETGDEYRRLAYLGGENTFVYHPRERLY